MNTQSDFQSLAEQVAQEGTPADIAERTKELISVHGHFDSDEFHIRDAAMRISWIRHFRLAHPVVEAAEF